MVFSRRTVVAWSQMRRRLLPSVVLLVRTARSLGKRAIAATPFAGSHLSSSTLVEVSHKRADLSPLRVRSVFPSELGTISERGDATLIDPISSPVEKFHQ